MDTETLRSADDCRWCGCAKAQWFETECPYQGDRTGRVLVFGHSPIGWRDFVLIYPRKAVIDLHGSNIIVLDLETLRSADDCRWCGNPATSALPCTRLTLEAVRATNHERIGWRDFPCLGLSIGCYYDYMDDMYHWFDVHTLTNTIRILVERQPTLVSFNGTQFDFPLMEALCALQATKGTVLATETLCAQFLRLAMGSMPCAYDILAEIWEEDPDNKYQKGNGLDAVSQANGYGAKQMDGATAPRLWAAGRYAEVIEYCMGDVYKTRKLFEQVCRGEPIQRQAGAVLLPRPYAVVVCPEDFREFSP